MTARSRLLGGRNPLLRRQAGTSVGPRSAVTFPNTALVLRAQIALGADLTADPLTWPWADITNKVRFDLGVSLTTGRRDEASQLTTGSAVLKLDNRDGRFTRRNPTGPYYGLLSKNTPIWITVDAGSGEKTRLEMFVNEWPVRWTDKSANDSTVTIRCAGVLRRLAQGRVLKSALRRAILRDEPDAYWPLEDGSGSLAGASGLPFGNAISVSSGTVDWAVATPPDGSVAAPDLSASGRLHADLGTAATSYTIEFVASCAQASFDVILSVTTSGGTYPYWWVYTQDVNPFGVQLIAGTSTSSSTTVSSATWISNYEGEWHHYRVTLNQVGGNVEGVVYVDGVAGSGAAIPATLGTITAIDINSSIGSDTIVGSVGHVAIYNSIMASDHSDAVSGYMGESAADRINRLCEEEGVICETHASDSASMGPQGIDTLPNLIQEAVASDLGILYEKRWGLGYRSLNELYNQPVSIALDFDGANIADLPEPADDDQRTRNHWTVSRVGGSEATVEEDSGPMGTGTQGPGVYDDSANLSVETDTQLANIANWLLHLGTVDEDRWPAVGVNFTRSPDLIDTFTALPLGARITVANPPTQMPPDDLDLIVEGYSERFDTKTWRASLNCSPASPYRVYVVGSTDGNLGRVDAANSTLAADATDVATSISVASSGAPWTPGAVNFDANVAGERMTVTDIGTVVTDTFTRTVSNGWGTADTGQAWTNTGGAAADYSVGSGVGSISNGTVGVSRIVTGGTSTWTDYEVRVTATIPALATGNYMAPILMARYTNTNNYYYLMAEAMTDGTVDLYLGTVVAGSDTFVDSVQDVATYTAGSSIVMVLRVHGTRLLGKAWAATTTEPASWSVSYDNPSLTAGKYGIQSYLGSGNTNATPVLKFDDFSVASLESPQTFTVVRSVNGVVKAQYATVGGFSTKVALWHPPVYALL